jgi:hypothetical protein
MSDSSEIHDVIQAFIDGEPVDPTALDAALAEPDGRAHLIDIVVLRKLVKRSSIALPTVVTPAPEATSRRPARWLAAAAILVTIASVGGYLIGERSSTRRPVAAASPAGAQATDAAPPPPRGGH